MNHEQSCSPTPDDSKRANADEINRQGEERFTWLRENLYWMTPSEIYALMSVYFPDTVLGLGVDITTLQKEVDALRERSSRVVPCKLQRFGTMEDGTVDLVTGHCFVGGARCHAFSSAEIRGMVDDMEKQGALPLWLAASRTSH